MAKKNKLTKPTCKTLADGTKTWYLNGKRHREDGPAIEYADGSKYWVLNGDPTTAIEVFKQANENQQRRMLCFYASEFCER